MLKAHSAFLQFVHRKIDIADRKIQDRERGRNMIRLRINQDIVSAGQM